MSISKKIVFVVRLPALAMALMALFFTAQAQDRYVVHFTDKSGTNFRIDKPEDFLSQRAIDRRTKNGVGVTVEDFPVNPSYLSGLNNLGVDVFYSSRWFNAALIEANSADLPAIESLQFVNGVEFVAPGNKLSGQASNRRVRRQTGSGASTKPSNVQNAMMGVDAMHGDAFVGQGMLVAVLDGGFSNVDNIDAFQHLYDNNLLKHAFDYTGNSQDVYRYSDHGTGVLSCIVGFKDGEYSGTAPGASVMLFVTEDVFSEYRIEEYNWLFAAEFADSAGVDVINTSLGYSTFSDPSMNYIYDDLDGNTAVISRAATIAAAKGMLIVNSAGNSGNKSWHFINAPADANNILTIGAVTANKTRSSFSSFGPTSDGRTKPELVSLGSGTAVINGNGNVVNSSGTSFSSPLVAGLAAGVWQAYPDLTSAELRELLIQSGSNAGQPNNEIGHGIPNYEAVENIQTQLSQIENFRIFPNPTFNSQINILTKDPILFSTAEISLFNLAGQQLLGQEVSFNWLDISRQIDLSIIPAGVYVLHIRANDTMERLRIVKQ